MKTENLNMAGQENKETKIDAPKRGMVLPFQPLSLAFNHVNYYVDMPAVSQPSLSIYTFYMFYFN